MLKTYKLQDGKILESCSEINDIMVFVSPDEKERQKLIEEYKLDEHTLNSALDPDELSRMEFEPEHIAIIYKRPRNYSSEDELEFKVISSGLFIFKDKLIIVQPDDIFLFNGKPFNKVTTLTEIMLKLISRSIFHFLEHLRIINVVSDKLEDKINSAMENKYLLNLFTLEKSMVYYLNAIDSNDMLLEKLKKNSSKISFNSDEMEYLDDIIVENSQCNRLAGIYSNILASLMDARASIVGNNLNVLMKRLNIITIGIMLPTLIVSVFSMNVPIPLSEHTWAFWIIIGSSLAAVLGFVYFWRRIGW
ncbi:MAG: magnesium transporter CorA family protein [Desulfobacterales bacterium]|nr:magnesium transporter CorA family protein [Desulfobacterales bacterium]MBF0397841.1 magnesium transporter CorA family protein [Desulfobacterales bacterium]